MTKRGIPREQVCVVRKDGTRVKGGAYSGANVKISHGFLVIMANRPGACLFDGRNSYERLVVRLDDVAEILFDENTVGGPIAVFTLSRQERNTPIDATPE